MLNAPRPHDPLTLRFRKDEIEASQQGDILKNAPHQVRAVALVAHTLVCSRKATLLFRK